MQYAGTIQSGVLLLRLIVLLLTIDSSYVFLGCGKSLDNIVNTVLVVDVYVWKTLKAITY